MRVSTDSRSRSDPTANTASSNWRRLRGPACALATPKAYGFRRARGEGQNGAMTRVFLLDDHEIVRRGLRELLEQEPDFEVVGEAGTAEEALQRVPPTQPDVALLDVRLPDGDGIEVCRDIRSLHPEIRCLMLTSFADDEALFSAIMAGASG